MAIAYAQAVPNREDYKNTEFEIPAGHAIVYPVININFYVRGLKPLKASDVTSNDDNGLIVALLEALTSEGKFKEVSRTEYLPWTSNPKWRTVLKAMFIFQNQQPCRINIYHVKSQADELTGLCCVGTAECDLHELVSELGKPRQYSLHVASRMGSRGELFVLPIQAPAAGGVLHGAFLVSKKKEGNYIELTKPIKDQLDQVIYTGNLDARSGESKELFQIPLQMLIDDDDIDQSILRVKILNESQVEKMKREKEKEDAKRAAKEEKERKKKQKKEMMKAIGLDKLAKAEKDQTKKMKKKIKKEEKKKEQEEKEKKRKEAAEKRGEYEPVKITKRWKLGMEKPASDDSDDKSDSDEGKKKAKKGIADLLNEEEKKNAERGKKEVEDDEEEEDEEDDKDKKKKSKKKDKKKKDKKEKKPIEPEEEKDPEQIEKEKEAERKRKEEEEKAEEERKEREKLMLEIKRVESHHNGVCQITARDIIREGMVKRTFADKKGKVYANFQVVKTRIERRMTLCDYFASGLQIDFHVGIDFTAANNDPSIPISLHYHHDDKFNIYESFLHSFGSLLTAYNYEKQTNVYGFGEKVSEFSMESEGKNFFSLNDISRTPHVSDVNGLLELYKESTMSIELAGSNDFSQLINHVRNEQHRKFVSAHGYGVLLILVRDDLSPEDWEKTQQELIASAQQAITIIVIGVRAEEEETYKNLKNINALSGAKSLRKNLIFVRYKENDTIADITSKILMDLPSQIDEFCMDHDFIPDLTVE